MPSEKSARVSRKRRLINRSIKSTVHTHVSRAKTLVESGAVEEAAQAVQNAMSALDRAAQKGVIHPNKAARSKSRLMKRLNRAKASAGPASS
ncbi:MAG: 30S ribosomal protein S20 [Chloroflexi bacterium]|nr:30S ribosomal protein S20 [Chloroflexota bacterium]